ncbi:hypothetical protein KKA23_01970 [Patescibacteria group bacterium]|nr:hypothetical protein [Patescibacteria group bacterium]
MASKLGGLELNKKRKSRVISFLWAIGFSVLSVVVLLVCVFVFPENLEWGILFSFILLIIGMVFIRYNGFVTGKGNAIEWLPKGKFYVIRYIIYQYIHKFSSEGIPIVSKRISILLNGPSKYDKELIFCDVCLDEIVDENESEIKGFKKGRIYQISYGKIKPEDQKFEEKPIIRDIYFMIPITKE